MNKNISTSFLGADMSEANLRGADMRGANLLEYGTPREDIQTLYDAIDILHASYKATQDDLSVPIEYVRFVADAMEYVFSLVLKSLS